ncbi:uncharacterized protein LOC143854692 [Tasmannia lanceolata]|uniref:uncharacterized protein LOC143854692 n=1 Tax=Tasmannia lanceolata TaxID=3420 RepID=UPI004063D3C4
MAEEHQHQHREGETCESEVKDRGLLGFLGKKKENEKPQEEGLVTEFEKVQATDETYEEEDNFEEERPSAFEKLHPSQNGSSSSDEEEVVEGEKVKKQKKKVLKEMMDNDRAKEEETNFEFEHEKDTPVPIEKVEEIHPDAPDQKKGFLDKIKDILPGHTKKTDDIKTKDMPPEEYTDVQTQEGDAEALNEKKSVMDKIKEKMPGHRKKGEEEINH